MKILSNSIIDLVSKLPEETVVVAEHIEMGLSPFLIVILTFKDVGKKDNHS